MKKTLAGLALLAVMAVPAAAQKGVFVTRHADKADEADNSPGSKLSTRGEERARALAALLKAGKITAILASETDRAMKTAEPLAKELGIKIETYNPRDTAALVKRLREKHANDVVLVVGHSNTVGAIAQGLGYKGDEPLPTDYGWLYLLVPKGEEAEVFRFNY